MTDIQQVDNINLEALSDKISLVCSEYHVFGKVVERKSLDPTAKPEYYILVGINNMPSNVDPKEIANRADRSFLLFYPHYFALKIDGNTNPIKLVEETKNYCKEAEFIKALYNEFGCEIPEVIRVDELYSLTRFNDQRQNKKLNPDHRQRFHRKLQAFFKKERPKNRYQKAWKKHYRSERFDEKAVLIKQYWDFINRNNPEVSSKDLQRSCDKLKFTVMYENEYQYFRKQMKEFHPDVLYAVGDKCVVDHGIVKMPKGVENPFGESVTRDEYVKIREEKFAESGFAALENLDVSRWEFRDVMYRAADESIIASVLNPFRYRFIKDNELNTVLAFGESDVLSIPANEMMNFYSLARSYNLPFYIDDNNQYADASVDYIQVVYSQASQPIMDKIINQLVGDMITGSHMISEKQCRKHLLANQINDAALIESQNSTPVNPHRKPSDRALEQ